MWRHTSPLLVLILFLNYSFSHWFKCRKRPIITPPNLKAPPPSYRPIYLLTKKYIHTNIYTLPNGPFAPNNFFSAKNSKVTIIKTKSATIAFLLLLSFFSLFLFPLSSSFVNWFSELLGLKKPAFWHLCTQMTVTANFVRLVFKKMVRYISCYKTP